MHWYPRPLGSREVSASGRPLRRLDLPFLPYLLVLLLGVLGFRWASRQAGQTGGVGRGRAPAVLGAFRGRVLAVAGGLGLGRKVEWFGVRGPGLGSGWGLVL